jgi:hypothetical protein
MIPFRTWFWSIAVAAWLFMPLALGALWDSDLAHRLTFELFLKKSDHHGHGR